MMKPSITDNLKSVYQEKFSESKYIIREDDETFPFLELLFELYNDGNNKEVSILDAGCGDCRYIRALHNKGYKNVKGVDLIQYFGDDSVDFLQAEIDNLPFEDSVFDIVYCASVLYYLENVSSGVVEFNRVLKENGLLLLTVTTKYSPYTINRVLRKFFKTKNSKHLEYYHFRYSVFDYIKILKNNGFEIIYISGFRMIISSFIKLITRKLVRIILKDELFVFKNDAGKNKVMNCIKSILAYHAVIIARKKK